MPTRTKVFTDKAPAPLPHFSQAIICNGMVYCSGNIGLNPTTNKVVEGSCSDRTVRAQFLPKRLLMKIFS
jgi:2-iminobutanoate/2-iminopropanoate deaminase